MQINQRTSFNLNYRDNEKCSATVHTHVDFLISSCCFQSPQQ